MSLPRHLLIAIVFLLVIAAPRSASAQWWEFIGEMSGPAMTGVFGGCKIEFGSGNGWQGCKDKHVGLIAIGPRLYEDSRNRSPVGTWPRLANWPRLWLALEAGYFSSHGKTPPDVRAHMGVTETLLEGRWCPASWWCGGRMFGGGRQFVLFHGSGFAYHHMVGAEFRPIQRGALRFRPLAGKLVFGNGWEIMGAWNIRALWDGITQDELTSNPATLNRPYELVDSYSAGVRVVF